MSASVISPAGFARQAIEPNSGVYLEQRQCRLRLPFPELRGKRLHLSDMMGTEVYDRDGGELVDPGLFIDHAPWHFNVFELKAT